MEEELRKEIREMRNKVIAIDESNAPDVYIMPKEVWNQLCKKMFMLVDKVKDLEKSRDKWKSKLKNVKLQTKTT